MKAIALISGGLDSLLAAKIIQAQGIEILPINFKISFCKDNQRELISLVRDNLGKELKIIDISKDFLKILKNPQYGYGKNINPCLDCKILMLKKAKKLMLNLGANFVVTGEVLGQRPMSQNKTALELITKKSGLAGLLLRPLSAKLLSPTIPEEKGWLKRENLLTIYGRSRKFQIALAKQLNLKNYFQPAGGCLLTDPGFSRRVKDLISHQELNLNNLELLKLGRHFRLSKKAKLIVGRNEKENYALIKFFKKGIYLFKPKDILGPVALGIGRFNPDLIKLASSIVCRYSDLEDKKEVVITYQSFLAKKIKSLKVRPFKDSKLINFRI